MGEFRLTTIVALVALGMTLPCAVQVDRSCTSNMASLGGPVLPFSPGNATKSPDSAATEQQTKVEKSFRLDGDVGFQNTGINIDEGDIVTIEASGDQWVSVPNLLFHVTPDGMKFGGSNFELPQRYEPIQRYNLPCARDWNHLCLLALIDDDCYHIGTYERFISKDEGELVLRANDNRKYLDLVPSGHWEIRVVVKKPKHKSK